MANLVDLEEIVLNWARLIFDTTKSKAEAKIKKKYLCGDWAISLLADPGRNYKLRGKSGKMLPK
ncbi:hypothetical protein ANCCEY_00207 [Ancylostoma ceylanicum]|uniref:Uncharacterized protein n=1 Tax=Ancylostoma ceylanicum TaxID=53326 RepID=A0A0D6M8Z5_9BILA|nr:hypothetical protein ANCCEY_00207 [Ancylostoma ceylanicum]